MGTQLCRRLAGPKAFCGTTYPYTCRVDEKTSSGSTAQLLPASAVAQSDCGALAGWQGRSCWCQRIMGQLYFIS